MPNKNQHNRIIAKKQETIMTKTGFTLLAMIWLAIGYGICQALSLI